MIHVHPLRVKDAHRRFINYTYVLVDDSNDEALVIDPGWELPTVVDCLMATNADLKGVLLTHHHMDHTRLASEMASRFDVPVFMSEVEKDFYGFECVNLQAFPPEQPLSIRGFTLFPYATPGHTKGSVCFQLDDFLFTGDTLFVEGCGLCPDRESAMEMFDSVQKLKTKIKSTMKIYPGHCYGIRPGVTFEFLLTQNIYCHLNDAGAFVSFRMRKQQTGRFNFK